MSAPSYCRDCGVYLGGGMLERDGRDPSLCWECGDEYASVSSICNGTCDTCDCDVWDADDDEDCE